MSNQSFRQGLLFAVRVSVLRPKQWAMNSACLSLHENTMSSDGHADEHDLNNLYQFVGVLIIYSCCFCFICFWISNTLLSNAIWDLEILPDCKRCQKTIYILYGSIHSLVSSGPQISAASIFSIFNSGRVKLESSRSFLGWLMTYTLSISEGFTHSHGSNSCCLWTLHWIHNFWERAGWAMSHACRSGRKWDRSLFLAM